MMGDYNQVLDASDKLSSTSNKICGSDDLRNCLNYCNLSEVAAKGQYFTWTNNREEGSMTWERLDRAFANQNWFNNYSEAVLTNLPITTSDHGPMILQLQKSQYYKRRPYRFEWMWTTHHDCKEIIRSNWMQNSQGSAAYQLVKKIKATSIALKRWNKECFGQLQTRKVNLEKELEELQQNLFSEYKRKEEREKRKEYALLLEQEQMDWMQKSRVNWIIHGERNTKFYHTITKKRRIGNRITQVEKTSGVVTEDPKEVEDTFLQAFKECFGEEEVKNEEQIMTYLQDIEIPKLNNGHLDKLNEPFTEEEIRVAAFQLGPTKAPGIDGKPAVFYQTYWDIVGDLTSKTALDFLNRGHILKELNKTLIALIPKRKDPSK
ncbi:Endonuclease/exonuclease/phosphatase, partial [Corchorus olitorius]